MTDRKQPWEQAPTLRPVPLIRSKLGVMSLEEAQRLEDALRAWQEVRRRRYGQ